MDGLGLHGRVLNTEPDGIGRPQLACTRCYSTSPAGGDKELVFPFLMRERAYMGHLERQPKSVPITLPNTISLQTWHSFHSLSLDMEVILFFFMVTVITKEVSAIPLNTPL